MKFSTIPILYLVQLAAIYLVTTKTYYSGHISAEQKNKIINFLPILTLWGGLSTYFGMSGFYQSNAFLSSLPGFWITQIPILIVMVPWAVSKKIRQGIDEVIDKTPLHLLMGFEGLRVLALGGVYKGYIGEFSPVFSKYIGIPDFLYGVTSLIAAVLIYRGIWKEKSAIIINIIGFIIIVPFGMLLINAGLPGPLHMIEESPGLETIFELPMALAPTLVVPIFVMVNFLVALRLIKRAETSRKETYTHSSSLTSI